MDYSRLRDPHEVPLYLFSVLVNLLIIALIVVGALLVGFLNALAGDPLSGPMVEGSGWPSLRCCSSCPASSSIASSPARAYADRR